MSKVFRLYKGGTDTYQGWNDSPSFPYNSASRDTIDDPDGASAKNEITSIPSPFARIDLVKTAFKEVCKRASKDLSELNGKTIFHKMVSDTLDVGEIFFNIDKFKNKIEVITWYPFIAIHKLKSDGNNSHFYVADALEKYMSSDSQTYNFNSLRNIYLLNYKEGPDELNIIGATSPATLFFCGANNLDYVNDIFFANNDQPFDTDYQPLSERDFEYIKVWWTLRKTIAGFSTLFPEIDNYLNLTFRALTDQSKRNQLNMISSASVSDFDSIDVQAAQQSNQVEVLGFNILKKKNKVNTNSEFIISPTNKVAGVLPMVLPVEVGNKYASLQYVNGVWGKTNKAPYYDGNSVAQRTLSYDGSSFGYLTISDFLEDTIIRVPHALNTKFFFDGGIKNNDEMSAFLLPLKPLYFTYFATDTLEGTMPDGKAAFEMESVGNGSINVTLRIPISGNNTIKYIEYQRIYYKDRQSDISATSNSGGLTNSDFTGLVMPSVRFQNAEEAIYTVSCISTFSNQFKLDFYDENGTIRDIPVDCRNTTKGVHDYKAETYTIEHHNFDYIRVTNIDNRSGVIVPVFQTHQNIDTFEFAVDLGTSNTHIEYKKNGAVQTMPFDIDESDALMCTFFTQTIKEINGDRIPLDLMGENDLILADFIPESVGPLKDFKFPTRTALSYAKCTDWTSVLRPFGLVNFNITYNKKANFDYNAKPLVNIKWSNQQNAQTAMRAYIKNIMLLIRNKIVANNGAIANTRITWFYPNSMSPRRLNQLRDAWNDAYKEIFNSNGGTQNLSESVAPIQFYFRRYATAINLINIDIGGGTTDVAFSSNGQVDYITSFKFAANSLFEDSFSDINPSNGIVDWFKDDIYRLLSSNPKLNELANIFNKNVGQPSNMASFLFSLRDNSATKSIAADSIDFNRILQNDTKFKIVFIIFYTAIIYHVAQIVKVKNMNLPRHIAFSGNGSKIIKVLTSDAQQLAGFTKAIFEGVLGKPYEGALDILGMENDANPKEATCKGGLINTTCNNRLEKIVLKDSEGTLVSNSDTYANIKSDDKEKEHIVDTIKHFFDFILKEVPSKYNLDDNFGVDKNSIKIATEECYKDLDTYLDKGLELSVQESGNVENTIEDAFSFYPIKGVIQALSTRLQEYYNENKE